MELVYLWVKKHKNICEQGFNFSSRFKCSFFVNANNENILRIEKRKKVLNNLYGENISLTAIVGENGVGKSTLLEVLSNKYDPTRVGNVFLVFYDKTNNILSLHGIRYKGVLKIELSEITEKKDFKINLISDGINLLQKTKTIYFSNILNENDVYSPQFYEKRNYSWMLNISTSQLLNQRKLIETNADAIGMDTKTNFDKIYRSYRIQQIQNAIILIKSGLLNIPFKLPEKLLIKNIDFNMHIKKLLDDSKNKDEKKYKVYKRILEIIQNMNNERTIFKNYLSTNIVISLVLELLDYPEEFAERYIDIILSEKLNNELGYFYDEVKNKILYLHENNTEIGINFIEDFFKNAQDILDLIPNTDINYNNSFQLEVDILTNEFNFLDAYLKLINQSEFFLDIGWRGISSGEETFLYQFSGFYHLIKGYDKFVNLQIESEDAENLILLIDEGEINLHPEWQKDYLNYLISFLKIIFSQKLHIILTTHSPFILSDIPNENIIFLNKYDSEDEEVKNEKQFIGNCKVLNDGINEKTFGANIHTLLSNGFFMKDGLMGTYAKNKIDEVIKFLNGEGELTSLDEKDLKAFINIIGEDFLKSKLMHMYYKKYEDEYKKEQRKKELIKLREDIDKELLQYD